MFCWASTTGPPQSPFAVPPQHASPVFKDMLASTSAAARACPEASPSSQDPGQDDGQIEDSQAAKRHNPGLKVALLGTSRRQALLLLYCLYAWDRTVLIEDLHLPDLVRLAVVADNYACMAMLHRIDDLLLAASAAEQKLLGACICADEAEAAKGAAWLNVKDAPALFLWAGQVQLDKVRAHLGQWMVLHAPEIDVSKLDATSAGFLRGAQQLHSRRIYDIDE